VRRDGSTEGNLVHGRIEGYTFLGTIVRLLVSVGEDLLTVDVGAEWFDHVSAGGPHQEIALDLPAEAIMVFPEEAHG
jgi:hypothetical protein